MFYNFIILAENNSSIESSYPWTDLIQGAYQFSVVAFTSKGPGEVATLILPLSIVANNGKLIYC